MFLQQLVFLLITIMMRTISSTYREGSLVVELNVVVDKNPTKMAQFAQELQSIRDGKEEIVYGDKTYTIQSIYVSTIPCEFDSRIYIFV